MPEEPKEDTGAPLNESPAPTAPTWGTPTPVTSEAPEPVVIDEAAAALDIEPATGSPEALVSEATTFTSPEAVVETPAAFTSEPAAPSSFSPFGESASTPTPVDLSSSMASEMQDTSVPSGAPVTPPVTAMKPKKSKKKFIIAGVIVLVLALLGGGGALAYTMYQNPQKVITDAIMSAVNAKTATYKGTINVDSTDVKASVTLTAKQAASAGSFDAQVAVTTGGKDYSLTGDGVFSTTGDLYVKLTKLDSITAAITSLANAQLGTTGDSTALVQKLVGKVDGTWIKISSDDLKSYSDTAATAQSCLSTALDKYKNDSSATKEITDLYQKHPFIAVDKDLGIQNGSVGYSLKTDKTAATAFVDGLKSTKIYTALHDCDSSLTLDAGALTSDTGTATGSIELWANQWTHQLTKLVLSETSDGTSLKSTIEPTFNPTPAPTVDTPSSSTTLTQLVSDLTSTLQTGN
jgi:hypothetical protein